MLTQCTQECDQSGFESRELLKFANMPSVTENTLKEIIVSVWQMREKEIKCMKCSEKHKQCFLTALP